MAGLPVGQVRTCFDFERRRRAGAVESRHGECERAGDSERAGDDERDAYEAIRERKDIGDVGDDFGLRYIAVKEADRSGDGIGIDKPGFRGLAVDVEANDVAKRGAYAVIRKERRSCKYTNLEPRRL